jgi:hypothetical protein
MFDTLKFANELKAVGVPDKQAEVVIGAVIALTGIFAGIGNLMLPAISD